MPYVSGGAIFPKIDDFNPREEHELMIAYAHKQARHLGFPHIARVHMLTESREHSKELIQEAGLDEFRWTCLWFYDQGFMEFYFNSEKDAVKAALSLNG